MRVKLLLKLFWLIIAHFGHNLAMVQVFSLQKIGTNGGKKGALFYRIIHFGPFQHVNHVAGSG